MVFASRGDEADIIVTLAHLDGLDLRRASDGWHGIWHVDGVTHQFWLPDAVPDAAAFYAVDTRRRFGREIGGVQSSVLKWRTHPNYRECPLGYPNHCCRMQGGAASCRDYVKPSATNTLLGLGRSITAYNGRPYPKLRSHFGCNMVAITRIAPFRPKI